VTARTRRTVAHACALLAVAVLAAGCGEDPDDFTALGEREIERIVVRDMKALESVHLIGASTKDRQRLTLDLVLTSRGDCSGDLTLGRDTVAYRQVRGAAYVKGDRGFWEQSVGSPQAAAQVVARVGDKWARLPRSGPGFGTFCDLDDFMAEFRTDRKATGADRQVTTIGEVSEVDGREALEVVTKQGQETTVTWVAVDEPHVVLRVESAGGDEPGSFRLDGFGEDVEVVAPDAADVVDLSR
jgi:hypothetical protein